MKAWATTMRHSEDSIPPDRIMPEPTALKAPLGSMALTVDDYTDYILNGERQDQWVRTTGQPGFLVCGPYRPLKAGIYTIAVLGEVDEGGSLAFVDVVCDKGIRQLAKSDITAQAGPGLISIFSLHIPEDVDDLEIRLVVAANTRLAFRGVRIEERDADHDYALVNKSYASDAYWSVVLFGSCLSYVKPDIPFYLVIPKQDQALFDKLFESARAIGFIDRLPITLYEDWVLARSDNVTPGDFTGWQVQQVVKLAFSKLGLCRQYLTCDSAQFFTQPFDFASAMFRDGILCTTARPQDRDEINRHFINTGEQCWLRGELVSAGVAFDAIDDHFTSRRDPLKYHYIGCNGIFDVDICLALEERAADFGYGNFAGMINLCPYEFAWYGAFVTYCHPELFKPIEPCILRPIVEPDQLWSDPPPTGHDGFFGYLFQKPACDVLQPMPTYLACLAA